MTREHGRSSEVLARQVAAGLVALLAMASLAACETPIAAGPGTPPANATVPLTVEDSIHEYTYLGFEGEQAVIGRIHYVDDVRSRLPGARLLGVSEPVVSRGMLVPGERNCVSARFSLEEPLSEPVYLGRAIFPIYPKEGDELTMTLNYKRSALDILVKNQHGNIYFVQRNHRFPGTVHETVLQYPPGAWHDDIEACKKMLSRKTPAFDD